MMSVSNEIKKNRTHSRIKLMENILFPFKGFFLKDQSTSSMSQIRLKYTGATSQNVVSEYLPHGNIYNVES